MEDIVYALDAIQSPLSLYDPVYNDGGDTLYVMDQISDKKNREENWVEHLSLNDAMLQPWNAESRASSACGSLREKPRWRWPRRFTSPRPRYPAWKRMPCVPWKNI